MNRLEKYATTHNTVKWNKTHTGFIGYGPDNTKVFIGYGAMCYICITYLNRRCI